MKRELVDVMETMEKQMLQFQHDFDQFHTENQNNSKIQLSTYYS